MTKFERYERVFTWAWIVLSVIAWLFLLFVGIDERVGRDDSEWQDGGGRHIEEMVSPKLSKGE